MPEEKKAKAEPKDENSAKLEAVYNTVLNWLNTEMGNRLTQNNSFALMHQVSHATGMPLPRFVDKPEEK